MPEMSPFLAHYTSQYYDPVKAHDYYVKTRQLKGKPQKLSDTQKEGLSYAKNEIATNKKKDLDALDSTQKAQLELIAKRAEKAVTDMNDRLEKFMERLAGQTPSAGDAKRIAFMKKQAGLTKKRVAKDVQTAIKTARESYTNGRKAIIDKYDKASDSEDANIRAHVR
jgi:hypothetical protein